nr:DapH/DapD/GlmU-related protein [uncultured Rhodoferax sp.]
MIKLLLAALRRVQTYWAIFSAGGVLTHGSHLHVGRGSRLWAPQSLRIGSHVYIGKQVHIEANCDIGDYCLLANRVAIVGRHDHDFTATGFPIRYAPWIGSKRFPNPHLNVKAIIEPDVWLGYGVTVLTGTTVGRGSVVAAGSVVSHDIPPYSIAAGIPAKVIGQRFADDKTIAQHEAAIHHGHFAFSERSYDHCVIQPAFTQPDKT